MRLNKTPIEGLFTVTRVVRHDHRGSFTRLFGIDEMSNAGRPTSAVHVNTSTSRETYTLRGIHFQYPPFAETKIVSCTAGAIWDVAVDLRPDSPTMYKWFGTVLTPDNGVSLLIPEGFGHAFLTLEPNSTAVYVVSALYSPSHESGIRFDDPILSIDWTHSPKVVSEKDLAWGPLATRGEELALGFKAL